MDPSNRRAKEDVTRQQSRNWTTTVTITITLQRGKQSGHGGPEHFARLAVEGLATVPLLQVALQLAHASAVHMLVLQRMLHIFLKREVGRLRGTRFSRRSPTSGSSLLDGASCRPCGGGLATL